MSTTTMKRNLILAGMISASCVALPSASNAISLTLPVTSFSSVASGPVSVVSPTGSVLDSTATPNGFGGFFAANGNENFLAFGASGTQTISASQKNNNSSANTTFTVAAGDLGVNQTVSFQFAYQGIGAGNSSLNNFNITVSNPDFSNSVIIFNSLNGAAGYSTGQTQTATILGSFLNVVGDYNFTITVAESFSSQNTAAGFNQITVNTEVPFDFDPSAGVLLLGAGFGLNKFRKNLQAKKNATKI